VCLTNLFKTVIPFQTKYFGVYNHGRPSNTAAAWLAPRKTYFISVSVAVAATRAVLLCCLAVLIAFHLRIAKWGGLRFPLPV
jgi:hypothetical protein